LADLAVKHGKHMQVVFLPNPTNRLVRSKGPQYPVRSRLLSAPELEYIDA
jgi:hypothetical protein